MILPRWVESQRQAICLFCLVIFFHNSSKLITEICNIAVTEYKCNPKQIYSQIFIRSFVVIAGFAHLGDSHHHSGIYRRLTCPVSRLHEGLISTMNQMANLVKSCKQNC